MGFLDDIVAAKQRDVAAKRVQRPLGQLREEVGEGGPVRDFLAATATGGAVIAELKARTPTIPAFAQSASLPEQAERYARAGAAAISIVTDAERFGTSLADVTATRAQVALPVIAKDFVIDPYQIVEARAAGADAVLLIARLLELPALRDMHTLAHELGMAVLVETHSEMEILAAVAAGARIIGINNRDLDTMRVSLDTTRRLARVVPGDAVLVAESGIRTPDDIANLAEHGVSAFLVGGSLLDAENPEALLRAMVLAATESRGGAARP